VQPQPTVTEVTPAEREQTTAAAPAQPSPNVIAAPAASAGTAGFALASAGDPIVPRALNATPAPSTGAPPADVTGSVSAPQAWPIPPFQVPVASVPLQPVDEKLPTTIGSSALLTAAAAGDPAAAFEVANRFVEGRGVAVSFENRFVEGRGVAVSFEKAARWFERAANAGLAPAQYRLGSLYEKGQGVRKDLDAARRLYLAAAAKGNAKAMHNLAVLYAEGIDGKPDYKAAAEWFRKAANRGVADSQYNLGILYARGIGAEQNLAESYKWFALAAHQGDQDAGRKRDDLAVRLDAQSLMAAKLAVQTFTAQPQPDEAVNVKPPAGGWDRTAAAPAPPAKKRPAAVKGKDRPS
jgi:localization factor PodJL